MSAVSVNLSTIQESYGVIGVDSAKHMLEQLAPHSLSLAYCAVTKKFTVMGSGKLDEAALKTILILEEYGHWKPRVLSETDASGNRQVELVGPMLDIPNPCTIL